MNKMLRIIKDLSPLNRVFCSSDYDQAIKYLQAILPFKVISFSKKDERNGWVIPPKWDIKEAKICQGNKVIFDGLKHPLRIIALSKSFQGRVNAAKLKKHLFFDKRYNDKIPFHFRQQYRSWDRTWGFCVTKKFYDNLKTGLFDVVIKTKESPGVLKILEYTHQGRRPETFVFVAHLDHPGQANDDLAGCAVGVELFRRLRAKKTKYTYKLLLLPEIIGSEYYLAAADIKNIQEALFLEMLGTDTRLALQASLESDSSIEFFLEKSLRELKTNFRKGAFLSIVVNDEYVWQARQIPMASLSRFPYLQYHTDSDNFYIMSEAALKQSLAVLLKTVKHLERQPLVVKKFSGTVCLSNPKYNLYIDPGQPALGNVAGKKTQKMRLLMDLMPTIKKPTTIKALADKVGLQQATALAYLKQWAAKGLLEIT